MPVLFSKNGYHLMLLYLELLEKPVMTHEEKMLKKCTM